MRKSMQTGAALLTAVTTLGLTTMISQASSSTTYQRNKITKVKAQPYYSTRNAKTFRFVGTPAHFKIKANHNLKNFKNSTWAVSKKAAVKHNGKSSLYYYVKNARNGATGWVWHGYLKAGKDFQVTTAKNITAKNYIRAKSGKIYQFKGSNRFVKQTNGRALSTKQTYRVTKQRTLYKKGKAFKYYYVTSTNGVKGWVWNQYLKRGTYVKITYYRDPHRLPTTSVQENIAHGTVGNVAPNGGIMEDDGW